ncbi:MAG: hypothetical protein FJ087_00820 [Deltaproteobacteria bacterium]|nr:hypothetical protein [Deltaproteobacteria bacterium]
MRRVETRPPSFPGVGPDAVTPWKDAERWQVLCGDTGHWRVGVYAPEHGSAADVRELERHDCPELFVLLSGRVTLVLSDGAGGTREVPLEDRRPLLVTSPHTGYCPDGPHTGIALVVERDSFDTEYRPIGEWR